jgi:hypothetical protein
MPTNYDPSLNANLTVDDAGEIRGIKHLDKYRELEHLPAKDAAASYVRSIAEKLNLDSEALYNLDQPVSYLDPQQQSIEFRLAEKKSMFDTATYAFYQTYLNTPVWGAGITVTVSEKPARILGATNTSERTINAEMPSTEAIERYRQLFATGEKTDGRQGEQYEPPHASGRDLLPDILTKAAKIPKASYDRQTTRLIRGRFFIYRYDSKKRTEDHTHPAPSTHEPDKGHSNKPLNEASPTLPLPPPAKSINEGGWYLVAELIIRLAFEGRPMNWRMLVEVETDTVLYLRALISTVNGLVFPADPITLTGNAANLPNANEATLNPLRSSRTLLGLIPPAPNQALTGNFVQISDFELATAAPPTQPAGTDFNYGTRTNNFAAVNAYYHCDRFFRLVEDLGFTISTYFDGTTFPVPVDHRGRFGSANGIELNASCSGDGDGIANVDFELADTTDTANPIGIANDWRVVLHELGGHGILYDHVNFANFGFSHSAGDSFAVILNDPTTQATDRFESFPWVNVIGRRHDRTVAAGWGWDGPNDDNGYSSEQILSTTMFRVYRSIGGDSTGVSRREFAARSMAYLMLRAVGTLTPMSNPNTPALFLNALLIADAGDWTSEGIFGGAYGKVFIWSFEKQNLNNGARPLVDVYIDDGRAGEYQYQSIYWETTAIWNRRSPGGTVHEEPLPGTTNYAYVKIKNRGTSIANNVRVKGYHSKPLAGLLWPNDFQPMTTAELPAGTLQPNNAEEKTIGPFEWVPGKNATGEDVMMMIVSSPEDPSNVDNFTTGEVIEDWRLVPNDNNIAMRKVKFPPRLVTVIADAGDFGNACLGSLKDMLLCLSNSGFSTLTISNITSSSGEFVVPGVVSYPLTIEAGTSILMPIRFQPTSFGSKSAIITVISDDPAGPKAVKVSGTAKPPRLAVVIADAGNFGNACIGCFVDKMITLNNSGKCTLTINSITSSSAEFLAPNVLSYPLTVEAGDSIQVPIRFQPISLGSKSAKITVSSDDPSGPRIIDVSGNVPSGKIVVTGSTSFGGVKACCCADRTISICNVGDCNLHVSSVTFKRKSRHWTLMNNPFPATLRPGSCLSVVIRYKATEKCPRCCELVIESDDPDTPIKVLEVLAYTVWNNCGCKQCCDDCNKGRCEKSHNQQRCEQGYDCCDDDDEEDEHEDRQ